MVSQWKGKVGFDLLRSLRLRSRGINFVACRAVTTTFDVIGTMNQLEDALKMLKHP